MLPGKGNYFAEVLRDNGYRTGYYGKWHLYGGERVRGIPPGPHRYGFDHEFLVNNCTLAYDAARAWYWSQDGQTKLLYGDWDPYAQTRQAMEFVDRHADRPFALFLSWHPPHNWGRAHEGYDAPKDLLALYEPDKQTLRPTVRDTPQVRRIYQGHMAMITSIDRAFGWLMQKLEDKGLSLALHYRRAPRLRGLAQRVMRGAHGSVGPGYCLQRGKRVIELAPAGRDKGDAIAAFMREEPFRGHVRYCNQ